MGVVVKNSLAKRIYKLSQELHIPYVTVERVIKGYLEDITTSANNGEDIIVPGVFSIRMMYNEHEGHVVPVSRVSKVLREQLKNVKELPIDEERLAHYNERNNVGGGNDKDEGVFD